MRNRDLRAARQQAEAWKWDTSEPFEAVASEQALEDFAADLAGRQQRLDPAMASTINADPFSLYESE